VLIAVGLVAVAAASPAAAQRYSGGSVTFPPLYYFYRQLVWLALSLPVMILISMLPRERLRNIACSAARPASGMAGALSAPEVNGPGAGSASASPVQPSEFLKPFSSSRSPGCSASRERTRACRYVLSGA
jgi:cell division protein FtsW